MGNKCHQFTVNYNIPFGVPMDAHKAAYWPAMTKHYQESCSYFPKHKLYCCNRCDGVYDYSSDKHIALINHQMSGNCHPKRNTTKIYFSDQMRKELQRRNTMTDEEMDAWIDPLVKKMLHICKEKKIFLKKSKEEFWSASKKWFEKQLTKLTPGISPVQISRATG